MRRPSPLAGLLLSFIAGMWFTLGVERGMARTPGRSENVCDSSDRAASMPVESNDRSEGPSYAHGAPRNEDAPPPTQQEDASIFSIPLAPTDNARGSKDALVTVVEFCDFQAAFCGRAYPAFEEVRREYGEKVRFVFRERPVPQELRANPAANLALEAKAERGEAGFWEAYDLLFTHASQAIAEAEKDPSKSGLGWLDDSALESYGRDLKLDPAKVRASITRGTHDDEIDADLALADDADVEGGPTFFVNGRKVPGARTKEVWKRVIAEELAKAEALVATGTARAELYARIIRDGKTPPPPPRREVGPPPPSAPFKGNEHATVVLQFFGDFQCPYCKRAQPLLGEVLKDYGDRIKVVWRNHPLATHKDAPRAAEAAMEALEQGKSPMFWRYHDALYEAQGTSPEALERPSLERIASMLGLDMKAFRTAVETNAHAAEIAVDAQAANAAAVDVTPTMIVGGYEIVGVPQYSRVRRVIRMALRDAR